MAFEKVKLTNEIERLQDETREAYDDIFDWSNPGYVMRKYNPDDSRYKRAKKEYDVLYPKYIALKEKNDKLISSLQAKVDKLESSDKAEKEKKKTGSTLADAKIEYQRAIDSQDPQRIKTAKQSLDDARQKYQGTKSETPAEETLPEGEFNSLDAAKFGKDFTVVYDPSTRTQQLKDGNNNERFVYTDADGNVSVELNFSVIQKKMIADAKAGPGGLDKFFTDLYEKNLISRKTFDNKDLTADDLGQAMLYVTREYSKKTWGDYTYGNQKQASGFLNWFDSTPRLSSASEPTRRIDITLRQDSDKEINQFFVQTLGRAATDKEKEDYYTELNKAERKAVETTRSNNGTVTTTGQNLTETDKLYIRGKVAGSAIKGTDVDTILSAGGDAAENVNTILSYANRNGLAWTRQEAMASVADAYRNGKTMDNIRSKIKNLSKFKYTNLSPMLAENDDIDIYDLGQSYGSLKSQILELGDNQYSVFDPDIQAALNNNGKPGLMTETEFRKMLKKKPEWQYTKNAREEAANYANDILRSFGLVS